VPRRGSRDVSFSRTDLGVSGETSATLGKYRVTRTDTRWVNDVSVTASLDDSVVVTLTVKRATRRTRVFPASVRVENGTVESSALPSSRSLTGTRYKRRWESRSTGVRRFTAITKR